MRTDKAIPLNTESDLKIMERMNKRLRDVKRESKVKQFNSEQQAKNLNLTT